MFDALPAQIESVQGHELGSVGERCFDLHLVQHPRHIFRHVVTLQHVSAVPHQISNPAAAARSLQHPRCEHGNHLGIVAWQSTFAPGASQACGRVKEQSFLFMG
ncbi:MAG: hypothetical protein ACJASK_001584 [Ilumatobacter sp.]